MIFGLDDLLWAFCRGQLDAWRERNDPRPQMHGLYLFTGLPGSGKTLSVTHQLYSSRQKHGDRVRILTNYGYQDQDGEFSGDWQELLDIARSATKPTLVALDEIGTLLSARSWADFPPEVLSLVSQRRKLSQGAGVRILGTVQRLWMTDKYLRELADAVVICRCLWGRLLIQAWYEPGAFDPASGQIRPDMGPFHTKRIRLTPDLWNRYDTFRVIERLVPAQDPANRRARTSGPSVAEPPQISVSIPGVAAPVTFHGTQAEWKRFSRQALTPVRRK